MALNGDINGCGCGSQNGGESDITEQEKKGEPCDYHRKKHTGRDDSIGSYKCRHTFAASETIENRPAMPNNRSRSASDSQPFIRCGIRDTNTPQCRSWYPHNRQYGLPHINHDDAERKEYAVCPQGVRAACVTAAFRPYVNASEAAKNEAAIDGPKQVGKGQLDQYFEHQASDSRWRRIAAAFSSRTAESSGGLP